MGRAPCCDKVGLKKGPWTPEEDQKLLDYVKDHGHGSWRSLPLKAGLLRCGKSCRLRWANYLRPDIKRGKFSAAEEQTIMLLHALVGNRWSAIASYLPQRTDNEVKNFWNTHLKKRLLCPNNNNNNSISIFSANIINNINTSGVNINNNNNNIDINNILNINKNNSHSESLYWGLSHKAQWECARREAEARLVVALDRSRSDCSAETCPQSSQLGSFLAESQLKSGDGDQWEDLLTSQHELPSLPAISGDLSCPSDAEKEEGGSRLRRAISSSCCSSSRSLTSPALGGEEDKDEWASILEHLMDNPLSPTSSLHFIGSHHKEDGEEEDEQEEKEGYPLLTLH